MRNDCRGIAIHPSFVYIILSKLFPVGAVALSPGVEYQPEPSTVFTCWRNERNRYTIRPKPLPEQAKPQLVRVGESSCIYNQCKRAPLKYCALE